MPIYSIHPVIQISQAEFAELAYDVMRTVFAIRNGFGKLFDEKVYKRELASCRNDVENEFPIIVAHGDYRTTKFLDTLVARCGPFEFKSVDVLTPRHVGQLYNYLLMLEVSHGKLVNFGSDVIEHPFVNCTSRLIQRQQFKVCTADWDNRLPRSADVLEFMVELIRDWGVGLQVSMYESALTHYLGGEAKVLRKIPVFGRRQQLCDHTFRTTSEGVAIQLTALDLERSAYEIHLRSMLEHTSLRAVKWINIGLHSVTFKTLHGH